MNLDQRIAQKDFAELVGVSEAAVSGWLTDGVLQRGNTGRQWLQAYCARLREQAAGRDPSGELASERARVARETADKIAMENAVRRRELAPVALIEEVLAKVGRRIASVLEAVPVQLGRRCPELAGPALQLVEAELARARNVAAAVSLASLAEGEDQEDAG